MVLSGYNVIHSDNNVDIRLSYVNNKTGYASIITLEEDFDPAPEGKDAQVYTFDLLGEPTIAEGKPLKITEGWGASLAGKNNREIPFQYVGANKDYEVFEMLGEIYVGIPHKHYENGEVIARYYFHVDKDNVSKKHFRCNRIKFALPELCLSKQPFC